MEAFKWFKVEYDGPMENLLPFKTGKWNRISVIFSLSLVTKLWIMKRNFSPKRTPFDKSSDPMRVILLRLLRHSKAVRVVMLVGSFVIATAAACLLIPLFHYNGRELWLPLLWPFHLLSTWFTKHQKFPRFTSSQFEWMYAFVMVGKCELVPFISFLNTIYVNHSSICLTMIAFVFRKKKAVT